MPRRAPLRPGRGGRAAGRMCPADYRLFDPAVFDRARRHHRRGALRGRRALRQPRGARRGRAAGAGERAPVTIVFNGDFHWFDAEPDWFAAIERGVGAPSRAARQCRDRDRAAQRRRRRLRLRLSGDGRRGRGPALQPDPGRAARRCRGRRRRVAARRACRCISSRRSAACASASCTATPRRSPAGASRTTRSTIRQAARWLAEVPRASRVDVFASTHTCLAALRDFALPNGRLTVINNGAAGMPNFAGTHFGLISRIATRPSPHPPLYGTRRDGVHHRCARGRTTTSAAFLDRFLAAGRRARRPTHPISAHRRRAGLRDRAAAGRKRSRAMSLCFPSSSRCSTRRPASPPRCRRSRRCARAAPR